MPVGGEMATAYNWVHIWEDYYAGELTVAEIEAKFGLNTDFLTRKAKKEKKGPAGKPFKRGREPLYSDQFVNMARVACSLAPFTDITLGKLFSVSKATIAGWKNAYPEFKTAVLEGKRLYDNDNAVESLNSLVSGIKYTETTKEIMPVGKEKVYDDDDNETGEKTIYKMIPTKRVRKFIPPNIKAIQFHLTNRDPESWKLVKAMEITGKGGGPIDAKLSADEVLAAMMGRAMDTTPDLPSQNQEMAEDE